MHFNVKKCASLSITRKRNPKIFQYSLMGEILNRVQKHDYLGVTIAHDLWWNDHCSKVINKASRTLGLLRRTLSPCTKAVKSQAYSTLVRPQLEYASEIWNPNTTSEINRLEQVQRSSARFVFADYNKRNHVTPLIQELNWDSLHTRRLIQQATMLYRIQYALVNITFPPCFQRASHISLRTDHPLKIINLNPPTMDSYKFAFYPRAVAIWNKTTSRSCPTHQSICQPLPGVCSSGHQGDVTPAWLSCPVMLLPSFVRSAPYVVKKYFILEHLLCLENELLFWSTFYFVRLAVDVNLAPILV